MRYPEARRTFVPFGCPLARSDAEQPAKGCLSTYANQWERPITGQTIAGYADGRQAPALVNVRPRFYPPPRV